MAARRALVSFNHFVPRRSIWWTSNRSVSTTPILYNDNDKLESAKQKVLQLTEDPGNTAKLQLYALYKQATVGKCTTSRPGMMDFVGRAKWDSWNNLENMNKENAIKGYCDLVDSLVGVVNEQQGPSTSSPVTSSGDDIIVSDNNGVRTVTLNRPKKKNAITVKMYNDIESVLKSSATDDSIKALVLTGAGDYYCSGNDLSNFLNIPPEGPEKMAKDSAVLLKNYVDAYIQFPKPLIAAINGPAVGISVTVLGLFDFVYAADNATFHTPFAQLGQSPEGTSSFLFPRIMGITKANEVLLLGRKITAQEAQDRNLVTRVFPQNQLMDQVNEIATQLANLPPNALRESKRVIRDTFTDMLLAANARECDLLVDRWLSDECMTAIMNFMQRKK